MSTSDYDAIRKLAEHDVHVLAEKGRTYGDSWKMRGGVGAFMMMARKWDRIENISKAADWDVIGVGVADTGGILDDIADLRRYLLLVEQEARTVREAQQQSKDLVKNGFLKKREIYADPYSNPLAGLADSVGSATGRGYTGQGG